MEKMITKHGMFIPVTITWSAGQQNFVRFAKDLINSNYFNERKIDVTLVNFAFNLNMLDSKVILVLKELKDMKV